MSKLWGLKRNQIYVLMGWLGGGGCWTSRQQKTVFSKGWRRWGSMHSSFSGNDDTKQGKYIYMVRHKYSMRSILAIEAVKKSQHSVLQFLVPVHRKSHQSRKFRPRQVGDRRTEERRRMSKSNCSIRQKFHLWHFHSKKTAGEPSKWSWRFWSSFALSIRSIWPA